LSDCPRRGKRRMIASPSVCPATRGSPPRPLDAVTDPAEFEALFDLGYHLKHTDTIFGRVFWE